MGMAKPCLWKGLSVGADVKRYRKFSQREGWEKAGGPEGGSHIAGV